MYNLYQVIYYWAYLIFFKGSGGFVGLVPTFALDGYNSKLMISSGNQFVLWSFLSISLIFNNIGE